MTTQNNNVENRILRLNQIIESKTESLEKAPQGTLRVLKTDNRIQYYHRDTSNHNCGVYLGKDKNELVRSLAQKDYDKRVLKAAKKEMKLLESYSREAKKLTEADFAENIFHMLSAERQKLVKPILLPDEFYIEKWQNEEYERKPFREDYPEYYTDKGERVRSKSEVIIANLLNKMEIPYHYERPLKTKGGIVIYPDFTVLRVRTRESIFLEHLGMMDDISYNETAMERLNLLERNGYLLGEKLFITFETRKHPLNMRTLKTKFEHWFL